jgi:hypothetical protein
VAELGLRRPRKPVAFKAVRVRIPPPPLIMNKESLSKESQPPIESPFSFLVEIYKKFLLRAGFTEKSIYLDFNLESVLDPKIKKLIKKPTEETIITFGRIIGTSPAGPNIEEIKKKVGEEGQVLYSYGLLFEFLKTILSPIIFPGYIAVRTCFEDDKKTFIDEFLINIESREVVLYISDKAYHEGSSPRVGTLLKKEKRNPNFTRHPEKAVNNIFDFVEKTLELTEDNFSYLLASHRKINQTFYSLSKQLTREQLVNTILDFLRELRIANEGRRIFNYLPQREDEREKVKDALNS